jgi:hypothetical protein
MAVWNDPYPKRKAAVRRRRYVRQADEGRVVLTPQKLDLLQYVADYRIVSLPQLARLASLTPKSARWHLRTLFDSGLVEVVPVTRVALADPGGVHAADLLFGSAPNVYTLTRVGMRRLYEYGLIERIGSTPPYGPKNSLFLAHELAVRDVRVWLEVAARGAEEHALLQWHDGAEAEIDLKRTQYPKVVRPDAWFVYGLGERVLVGLVEVDRGTERGDWRWKEKLVAYEALYGSDRLNEVTGYVNARVLVVTPDTRRRDRLAEFIGAHAASGIASRFWLAECLVLRQRDLTPSQWVQVGSPMLRALIPASVSESNMSSHPVG